MTGISNGSIDSRSYQSFNRFLSSLGLNNKHIEPSIEGMDDVILTSQVTPTPHVTDTATNISTPRLHPPILEFPSVSTLTTTSPETVSPQSTTTFASTSSSTSSSTTQSFRFIASTIGEITIETIPDPPLKRQKIDPFTEFLPPSAPPQFDTPIKPTIGIIEVAKLEYASKQLQKNLKLITKQAPDIYQLKLVIDSLDIGAAIEFQDNELLTMASRIKSRYRLGKLPIVDEIISGDVDMTPEELELLKKLQQDEICDVTPIINSSQINGNTNTNLPPLPQISDPIIKARVFTHKSYVTTRTNHLNSINGHNERLEFLGDSILNTLVTMIIYERFPNASEGKLSKIRSDLVNNKTLGHFSLAYEMDKRLKSSIVDLIVGPDQKLFADVFEAYIGGVALERNYEFEELRQWLTNLYTPMLNTLQEKYIKPELEREAKSELYSMIGTNDSHPIYKVIQKGDAISGKEYIVTCTMESELLGTGSGISIKEASLRAAMDALSHESKLEKFYLKRQEIELPIRKRRNELKEIRRIEKLKQLQNELQEAAKNPPLPPPSPIRTSIFPLVPDYTIPLDNDAKNELYALIGKKARVQPTYIVSKSGDNKHVVTLKIRGVTITSAEDTSKKKAMSRAARTLLNNEQAMYEISKSF